MSEIEKTRQEQEKLRKQHKLSRDRHASIIAETEGTTGVYHYRVTFTSGWDPLENFNQRFVHTYVSFDEAVIAMRAWIEGKIKLGFVESILHPSIKKILDDGFQDTDEVLDATKELMDENRDR